MDRGLLIFLIGAAADYRFCISCVALRILGCRIIFSRNDTAFGHDGALDEHQHKDEKDNCCRAKKQ